MINLKIFEDYSIKEILRPLIPLKKMSFIIKTKYFYAIGSRPLIFWLLFLRCSLIDKA